MYWGKALPFAVSKFKKYQTTALWLAGLAAFCVVIILNKDFVTFVRYLLLGLPQGAVIALIAVGYTMVYGIIQLINFAHGEIFMFSTYFVLMLVSPADPDSTFMPKIISVLLVLLFFCASWVSLGFLKKRYIRAIACLCFAVIAALANYRIMPAIRHVPLPFFIAYALALLYTCCLGVAMDLLAYRPLRNSPRLIPLITAIGLSLLLQNLAQSIWGASTTYFPESAIPHIFKTQYGGSSHRLDVGTFFGIARAGELEMSLLDLIIIGLAVVLMVTLQLFILRTRTGKSMRACALDRTTASLMGIRVNRVVALAFALGAGLAALVAPLYVIRGTPTQPQMGYIVGILAFASAVLGGIGNISGAMLGGMIIGIIYAFVPLFDALDTFKWFHFLEHIHWISRDAYESFATNYGRPSQFQLGVAYIFMIAVIVFKPTGLLGKASANRA
jgi:branched-chain amino acid transport system permease protein